MLRRVLVYGPLLLAGAALVIFLAIPWPLRYRWMNPDTTSFMRYRAREARDRGEELRLRYAWVPLERISGDVVRAVVSAEDGRFREHRGIDWLALREELSYSGDEDFSLLDLDDLRAAAGAVAYYLENRDEVRGRSTITQQLAKNLYFTPDRSLGRKMAEFFVAQRLEWFLDKDRILELYLNTVELGPGVFGVEAAAREYFGVGASELGAWQAASLAATLPHPLTSNPDYRPGRMAWRRDLILTRMSGRNAGTGGVPVAPEPVDVSSVEIEVPELEDPGSGSPGDGAPPEAPVAADTATVVDTVEAVDTTGVGGRDDGGPGGPP